MRFLREKVQGSSPQMGGRIAFFNCLDLYPTSPDFGEHHCKNLGPKNQNKMMSLGWLVTVLQLGVKHEMLWDL